MTQTDERSQTSDRHGDIEHHDDSPSGTAIDRRSFLQRLGLGAATVVVVADGLVAYRAWDQGVLTEGNGPAYDALEHWQDYRGPEGAVAAAVLAASAHNTQPWAFTIGDDRIELHADTTRTTGANDALLREFHLSLGCALENLVLAAEANGYLTFVTLHTNGDGPVATVALTAGDPIKSELYDAIPKRRSSRSDYTDEPVDNTKLAAMTALVDNGIDLTWLTTPSDKSEFARLLTEATRAHNDDEEQSLASFTWWRNDWDEIHQHKDGLNIDGAALPPLIRTLGRILPGTTRKAADSVFLERTEQQAATAAAFGVLTVADPFDQASQLQGGRVLQRLHLWAAAHDLGFQHMNQITERIDRDRQSGNPPAFDGALEALVGPGPLAAFRIGTPTAGAMASPRRPVEDVIR